MTKPNILVCTCDQLRAFEVGCYGNPVIRTPNLDRLARDGVRFDAAITNYPVCMAARSVLISGQFNRTCTGGVSNVSYGDESGNRHMPEYPAAGRPHLKQPTLAELLHDDGYHTAAIGKWHIHSWPHDIGFDDYVIPRVHHCHTGQSFTRNGGPEFVPPGYSVDFESDQVEEFLHAHQPDDAPFFLYYNISPPHCPVADAPEKYRTMYNPEDVPLRPNFDPESIDNADHFMKIYRWDFRHYEWQLPYTQTLPEGYSMRHVIAEYYGMTTWMDEAVGRMLRALDDTGLADDTIVVFTSDHGDNLGSHGLIQKGGPNEESARIPMIWRGPQCDRQDAVVKSHVGSLVDVAPTLLSLAGSALPAHFQGRNLQPLLSDCGEENQPETAAFIETSGGAGIRTPTHLYYLPFVHGERGLADTPEQFYAVSEDPCQLDNLAGTDRDADTAAALDHRLRTWDAAVPWMD